MSVTPPENYRHRHRATLNKFILFFIRPRHVFVPVQLVKAVFVSVNIDMTMGTTQIMIYKSLTLTAELNK